MWSKSPLPHALFVLGACLGMVDAHRLPLMRKLATSSVVVLTTNTIMLPALAEVDPVIQSLIVVKPSLDFLINTMSVFFLARIILSWYPKTDLKKFPYNAIVWPTEPLMAPARELLPPAFGVDISPIFWLGLLSFVREILTGQQGILTLLQNS